MALLDKNTHRVEKVEKDDIKPQETQQIYGETAHARQDSVGYDPVADIDYQRQQVARLSNVIDKLPPEDKAMAEMEIALAEQALNNNQRVNDAMVNTMKQRADKAEMEQLQQPVLALAGLGLAAQGLHQYRDSMQDIDPTQLGYLNASNGISDIMLAQNLNKNNNLNQPL